MGKSLTNYDPSQPAVDQVVGVVRHLEQRDEGVVSAGQENERDQIDSRHHTRSAENDARHRVRLRLVGHSDAAEGDIHGDDADNDEGVEPAGQSTHIDSPGELELPVVPVTEERSIDNMLLDLGESWVCRYKVVLAFIAETCQPPHMGGDAEPHLPDIHACCETAKSQQRVPGEVVVESCPEWVLIAMTPLEICC